LLVGSGGVTASSDIGLWSERTGALALVAREGDQAAGAPQGAVFYRFSPISVNADGRMAFTATLVSGAGGVTASNNNGIWSNAGGSLSLLGRKGTALPRAASGLNYPVNAAPALNRAGQAAVRSPIVGGGTGIWKQVNGTLQPVIVSGDQAPGTDAGVTFTSFSTANTMSAAGQVAFRGLLTGTGVTPEANNSGIWAERGNGLTLIARKGSATPIANTQFASIGELAVNRLGQTAFNAGLSGTGVTSTNNDAIWAEKDNVLALVARAAGQAPGLAAGVKFETFSSELLFNADSDVAFTATLVGTGIGLTNDAGIWARKDNVLDLVAAKGAAAPDGPQGAMFQAFDNFSLNSAGQVAFRGVLTGGQVTTESDKGIWAETLGGTLKLIAREGQAFEVAPGSTRTIATLQMASGVTEDGRGSAFNDRGEVAFMATFTDGSSGVFVSDVAKSSPGDFDGDLDVDGADFLVWQRGSGNLGGGHPGNGDANYDGNVNGADLDVWKTKFAVAPATSATANVPEPGATALLAWLVPAVCRARRRR
jgi:hypothetical protein